MMMRVRGKSKGGGGSSDGVGGSGEENWEMRPSGMVVQKRMDTDPQPIIRVRVKFGSVYHQINVSSRATFGELKKMLSGATGLHHEDQKLFFKGKERSSKEFIDMVGVKEKSKLVLMGDPIGQEKRYLERKKIAHFEKAFKSISDICLQVDELASQVAKLRSVISKGGRVAEKEVVNLIELLMNELIKLDDIVADGDAKHQRKLLVQRVRNYVETLEMLKIKNSFPSSHGWHIKNPTPETQNQPMWPNGSNPPPIPPLYQHSTRHSVTHSPLLSRHSMSSTVVTTQWETFDSAPPLNSRLPTWTTGSSGAVGSS